MKVEADERDAFGHALAVRHQLGVRRGVERSEAEEAGVISEACQEIGFGELLAALTSPDHARQLKLLLGKQFGDIEAQTRQVMENLKRVLAGCSLGLENVVSARIFLTRFEDDYERMNAVYKTYFAPGRFPARTCVGVTALARGARVEIDFLARR